MRTDGDRILLLIYRLDAQRVAALLPAGQSPRQLQGFGLGGVLLRSCVRGRLVWPGGDPESGSAGRAWAFLCTCRTEAPKPRDTALVLGRVTSSRWSVWMGRGGWMGRHSYPTHRGIFCLRDRAGQFNWSVLSVDRSVQYAVRARVAASLPASSLFANPQQACGCLQAPLRDLGALPVAAGRVFCLQPAELHWRLEPLRVETVYASVFEAPPPGAVGSGQFDSAFWLRSVEHAWSEQDLWCRDMAAV